MTSAERSLADWYITVAAKEIRTKGKSEVMFQNPPLEWQEEVLKQFTIMGKEHGKFATTYTLS